MHRGSTTFGEVYLYTVSLLSVWIFCFLNECHRNGFKRFKMRSEVWMSLYGLFFLPYLVIIALYFLSGDYLFTCKQVLLFWILCLLIIDLLIVNCLLASPFILKFIVPENDWSLFIFYIYKNTITSDWQRQISDLW